jgi:hypothetical protein
LLFSPKSYSVPNHFYFLFLSVFSPLFSLLPTSACRLSTRLSSLLY